MKTKSTIDIHTRIKVSSFERLINGIECAKPCRKRQQYYPKQVFIVG